MRIIQILNTLNWSAASNYCVGVSAELIRLGHEVLIITQPGYALDHIKQMGLPYDDSINFSLKSPLSYVAAVKRFKRIYKDFKPDIVSAHMNHNAWLPGFISKICMPKVVVARVRTDIQPPNRHLLNLVVYHKLTDHVITGSEMHKKVCQRNLFLSDDKIDVIYGSVDTEKFHPELSSPIIREQLGASEDDFLMCLVGRLSPIKGHEYALKTVSLLKDLPRKVKLVCPGWAAQRDYDWLRGEAERLGVSDRLIPVEGFNENLPALLASMDLGIITSIGSEANSRATLEYMASGLPVVGTSVGVIPEIIENGKTGFVVEHSNPEAMAEKIKYLLQNPEILKQMGIASRERIEEKFTLKQFGLQTEAVYQKLLAQR